MQYPEFAVGNFSSLVEAGDYKKALQTVFGVSDRPIEFARKFLVAMEPLSQLQREALIEWSKGSMEPERIDKLRWYVDQICRHEMGHALVARQLKFGIGEIRVQLKAADGDHEATSRIYLDVETKTLDEVVDYLERRVIVIMSGSMSESSDCDKIMEEFSQAWQSESSFSDRQKALEIIQILCNIKGVNSEKYFEILMLRTYGIVHANYEIIVRAASILSGRVLHFGQRVWMHPEEIENIGADANGKSNNF